LAAVEPFVVLILAAIGAVVFGYAAYQRQVRRREAIAVLCAQRGWSFSHAADGWVAELRSDFPLFRRGDGKRRCRDVVTIPGPPAAALFDYSYVERSTDAKGHRTERTIRHAVAVLDLPGRLPSLRIGPEGVLSRLGSAVGLRGIELESAEFNRRFRVSADDRTHAFDVLHPAAIQLLLDQPLDCWEVAGGRLLVARRGRWDVEDYAPTHALLERFVALVPDYVWRKHGVSP
jgi:hypothetical protein